MRIFRHFDRLPADARGGAVAIGNFDGVHLGHQAVIREAGRIARDGHLPWGVMTFEPHPRAHFQPAIEPFRITPFRLKARQMEAMGVDFLVVSRFDRAFARRPAASFVGDILVAGLAARHIVSGYDFAFGRGREGNSELLLKMGREAGFDYTCVAAVHDASGRPYSSTRAREALKAGDPRAAAAVLGRPFEIEGRVVEGDKRGRTIGYPTANVTLAGFVRPRNGVYAVKAGIDAGTGTAWHSGVANLGRRPTFGGVDVVLEVHLFDFAGDLYGRHLRVQMIGFLRPEKKFDGIAALRAQIAEDSARARALLGAA